MNSTTSHPQIDLRLIENALALTWRTMEDMQTIQFDWLDAYYQQAYKEAFSYPKFYAYLLSPEFIEKYKERNDSELSFGIILQFWKAIYEYQKGNPKPLEDLLKKI